MGKYFDILAFLMGKAAGGGGAVTVESKSIDANGTYTAPEGKAYSPVSVSVPNSYAAGDEGKVVSNGALVAQGSDTVTQNGTVDTTLINSLNVNVSGGGGIGTLLAEHSLGSVTAGTTVIDAGSFTFDTSDYDLLVFVTSKEGTVANGYHAGTVALVFLTASSNIATARNGYVIPVCSWQDRKKSYVFVTNAETKFRGIYPSVDTFVNQQMKVMMKAIADSAGSTGTGTINGTYTTRVYGIKLHDSIVS